MAISDTENKMQKYIKFRGRSKHVDKILALFDHLPPSLDIYYLIKVDKKSTFSDYLPLSSCKRSS